MRKLMSEQHPSKADPVMTEGEPNLPDLSNSIASDADDITGILPQPIVGAEAIGQTDVGRDRHHNEDFFVIRHHLQCHSTPTQQTKSLQGLYILCDGMGGHAKGEVASALAAQTLVEQLGQLDVSPTPARLKEAVYAANQAVYQANESQKGRSRQDRMGTTLVLTMIQDNQIYCAHVGDSRMYSFTLSRGLEQITVDHEVGQQDIQRGVDPQVAYVRPDAYQLTQALGPRPNREVMPDLNSLTVTEDTLLLLCSDGLTDNDLLETNSTHYLVPMLSESLSLQKGVRELMELANRENGHDNITVVAVRLKVLQAV